MNVVRHKQIGIDEGHSIECTLAGEQVEHNHAAAANADLEKVHSLHFASGNGHWSHFSEPAVRTSSGSLPTAFIVEMLWVMLGYSGWNAATYVAEEIRHPERILPLALAVGTAIVAVLYVGLNLVFIYATPLSVMSSKLELAPGAVSAVNLFGPGIGGVWAGLMALCLVSTVNAEVTVGPRVYYAMAKNRAFFSAAARVHPRFHTPIVAILSQGLCADRKSVV